MDNQIKILECTLRDGSYTIDFSFTKEDTYRIVKGLYDLGFEYIEVGHGLGLGVKDHNIIAKESDETYIEYAKKAAPAAKIASFFIPTVGKLDDIRRAKEAGLDILRIGTNISEYNFGKEAIKLAKNLDLQISWNLMKSYTVPPKEFCRISREVSEMGADVIVMVDSTGCMLPDDVRDYLYNMKENIGNAEIGFHCHNNLGLANANVLEAIKWGAAVIDTTISGMGRSAGNAQTEIIVHLLQKQGYMKNLDIFDIMEFANNVVVPLMKYGQGVNTIDIACGIGAFHSSFMEIAERVAKKHNVQLEKLIVSVGRISGTRITEGLVEQVALLLKK